MIFTTRLPGSEEVEIGKGEVKKPGTSKAEINNAKARVLKTAKRQLYLRIKSTGTPNKLIVNSW